MDLIEKNKLNKIFKRDKISSIINLAAQAGVRFSQISREPYVKSNLIGFFNLLEICKVFKIKYCYFASTSSVYGENRNFPLKEEYTTNPVSFYAATKICNEILAQSYSQMTNTKFVGLRFFTVYGPNGRPDMSIYKFIKNLFDKKTIEIFNQGKHARDYSYVDDVVGAIFGLVKIKDNKLKNYQVLI